MSERQGPPPEGDRPKRPDPPSGPGGRSGAQSGNPAEGKPKASSSRPRRPRSTPLPLFRVLLRGPGAEELAVVRALVELTPLSPGAARAIAAEADAQGRAVVLVAHRERAELYVERLAERGLPVGLEPAE